MNEENNGNPSPQDNPPTNLDATHDAFSQICDLVIEIAKEETQELEKSEQSITADDTMRHINNATKELQKLVSSNQDTTVEDIMRGLDEAIEKAKQESATEWPPKARQNITDYETRLREHENTTKTNKIKTGAITAALSVVAIGFIAAIYNTTTGRNPACDILGSNFLKASNIPYNRQIQTYFHCPGYER